MQLPSFYKGITQKEGYIQIFLINKHVKTLNKILKMKFSNDFICININMNVYSYYSYDQVMFFSRDEWLVQYWNTNIIHHINRLKKKNHNISWCRKHIWQHSTPTYSWYIEGNISEERMSTKWWKIECFHTEDWGENKDVSFHCNYST